MNVLLYYVYYLKMILFRVFYLIYNYVFDSHKETVLTIKDKEKLFHRAQKERFGKVLMNKDINYNSNIVKSFYVKSEYDEIMQQENDLEKTWKTRMLFQSTPQGNIAMYYDAYKLGFAYYSDAGVVSYDVLNSCAMKYVEVYRCLDFFMDEYVMKEEIMPIKQIHFKEEVVEKKEPKKFSVSNPVFAKFKQKPIENSKNDKDKDKKEVGEKEPERLMNKFISLGKMNNMKLLQTLPKKKGLGKFKSPVLEKLKFSDFKKMMEEKHTHQL